MAAISAATALASLALAVLGWLGGRRADESRTLVVAGATSTTIGTLAGTSAACVGAYADRAPAWAWMAIALAAPMAALLFARLRTASGRTGTT
jgi:predicted permease